MKNIRIIMLFAVLVFGFPSAILAQEQVETIEYKGHSTRFAFLVSNERHFQGVIKTAEKMNVKKNRFSFEIVVVGTLAKDLVENKELIKEIDKAEKLGVKIVVCEGAMKHFNVPKSQLDKRLLTTPNAWIYMFELQDKGFNTLSL